MKVATILKSATFAVLLVAATVAVATEPPDSVVNPQDDAIEIVDSMWTGSGYDVRLVRNFGAGNVDQVIVAGGSATDLDPKIAVHADGSVTVVWWRDAATDEVRARTRSGVSGSWSSARVISESGDSSARPEVEIHAGVVWAAWEYDDAGATAVAVREIVEDPDPLPTLAVNARTARAGDVDVRLHAEGGALWVTWLDDATDLGWSEYDATSGSWSALALESFSADDADAARERVRRTVLGP